VLRGLDLSIAAGATAILGPSGCGKSTLLRLLDRLVDPDEGVVRFRGLDVRELDPLELRRRVALVPQLPAPIPGSVGENVCYGPALQGQQLDPVPPLQLAGLDPSFVERDAARLSVGEQQRVMLARALALEPEVLLLDEPTAALDEAAKAGVEGTLRDLAGRARLSIVLVTHEGRAARGGTNSRTGAGRPRGIPGGADRIRVSTVSISLGEVAASLVLVAIAAAVSLWRRAELEEELGLAVLRSFLQLIAVGYVIQAIFDSDSLWLVALLLAVMVAFGSATANSRASAVPGALGPIVIALSVAAAVTLALVIALGVFEPEPRYLVPVGGMVIGNSMTATAVALNRLADEMEGSKGQIEASLALGATSRQASLGLVTRSLRSGMIPLIDSTKTTGVVFFPGTMVGMLIAGAEPIDAVRLQLVLLWVLLGSVALASLLAVSLGYRGFFTPAHQLRDSS
jgi:putative ABC transport system permease protein